MRGRHEEIQCAERTIAVGLGEHPLLKYLHQLVKISDFVNNANISHGRTQGLRPWPQDYRLWLSGFWV